MDDAVARRGKRRVGRREDRKRSLAFQRRDQTGRLQGRGERGERPGRDGRLDDVFLGRALSAGVTAS
jgi:hypothetical protein